MSSLSDVMSAAIAMMMSAAFVHFGVSGGSTTDPKTAQAPPAAHASVSASSSSDSLPIPTDDDRFSTPVHDAGTTAPAHVAKARRNS